jgi:hypothetical protein
LAQEILSLPIFPQLNEKQQARIVKEILAFSSASPGRLETVTPVEETVSNL